MSLENEFSRPVRLIDIAASPVTRTIEADKSERTALALRLDLIGLERFEAATRLERSHGGRAISVVGRLKAAVTYRCCVTLKPFSAEIDEAFEAVLALDPELMGLTGVAEEQVEIDEDSPEEFIAGDTVNLGEIATQYLALALDPYPKSQDAVLTGFDSGDDPKPQPGPFADLARLKK